MILRLVYRPCVSSECVSKPVAASVLVTADPVRLPWRDKCQPAILGAILLFCYCYTRLSQSLVEIHCYFSSLPKPNTQKWLKLACYFHLMSLWTVAAPAVMSSGVSSITVWRLLTCGPSFIKSKVKNIFYVSPLLLFDSICNIMWFGFWKIFYIVWSWHSGHMILCQHLKCNLELESLIVLFAEVMLLLLLMD